MQGPDRRRGPESTARLCPVIPPGPLGRGGVPRQQCLFVALVYLGQLLAVLARLTLPGAAGQGPTLGQIQPHQGAGAAGKEPVVGTPTPLWPSYPGAQRWGL